jgi:hypothetical protein
MQRIKKQVMLSAMVVGLSLNGLAQCNCQQPLPLATGTTEIVTAAMGITGIITAISTATGPKTIYLTNGIYTIPTGTYIMVSKPDITIRSLSGNRDSVIIQGTGMLSQSGDYHGFQITQSNCTIADLTIKDIDCHPIQVNFNTTSDIDNVLIHNVHIIDGGQQLIKINVSGTGLFSDYGVIECSLLEYTTSLPTGYWYTNGIDLQGGVGWIIRDNVVRRIKASMDQYMTGLSAGPAILCFKQSSNTTVERNLILDCDEGIFFGNWGDVAPSHTGGIIRNNIIRGDYYTRAGIGISRSKDAMVLNNTIYSPGSNSYQSQSLTSIEITGPEATNCLIQNNIMNEYINVTGSAPLPTQLTNIDLADATHYVNADALHPAYPDLHLLATSSAVNTGTANANRLDDIECENENGNVDIGADEYGGLALNISPMSNTLSWFFYPNPVKNLLNIAVEERQTISMQLMDVTGKIILVIPEENSRLHTIDVSHVPLGVYYLKIESANFIGVKPVVIE